jgi:hypothetical protein
MMYRTFLFFGDWDTGMGTDVVSVTGTATGVAGASGVDGVTGTATGAGVGGLMSWITPMHKFYLTKML